MRLFTIVTGTVALVSVTIASGQTARTSRVSPHESVTGRVDGAALIVTYGRPSMRGRAIFGALVPYGRVWCPGADEATVLDSTLPLQIGGLRVPAGPHTIWMLPTADAWTLIVSRTPSGFHTRYPASADLGRLEMQKQRLDAPVERLTFAIEANPSGGVIAMMWETTRVSVPFRVVQ